MKITDKLNDKRILLWGYGLEGKSTEKFINKYCKVRSLTVFQGKREDIDEDAYDLIIKSPGIVAENLSDKYSSMTDLFLEQFSGKMIGSGQMLGYTKSGAPADNEIDAISGCTITTSAVVKDVNAALTAVRTVLEQEE